MYCTVYSTISTNIQMPKVVHAENAYPVPRKKI